VKITKSDERDFHYSTDLSKITLACYLEKL